MASSALPYSGTKVPPEKTRMDIEILIKKYRGAEYEYREGTEHRYAIAFVMGGLKYR